MLTIWFRIGLNDASVDVCGILAAQIVWDYLAREFKMVSTRP